MIYLAHQWQRRLGSAGYGGGQEDDLEFTSEIVRRAALNAIKSNRFVILHSNCIFTALHSLGSVSAELHAGEEVKEEHLLNSESFPSYLLHSSLSNPTSMIFELGGCIDSHIDTSEWQRGVFAFAQNLSSLTDLCSGHGHP